ncbi:hypothetical protein ACIBCA_31005 [Kitasatospora sp. NPDC051170]|uniref:hypothetical protein n=1 Tax=Kitasatospora sp. NPDC051170 TaxID=3364056 RepID=UPI0037BAA2E9
MLKTSTTARTARASLLMASASLLLGSCSFLGMGDSETPAPPTRVESREDAMARATTVQDHLRELSGLEPDPWGKISGYYRCAGRGTGIADGNEPYQLTFVTTLKAQDDQRPAVIRALREKLGGEGFKVTADPDGSATAPATPGFTAVHESDPYTVSLIGDGKPGRGLGVSVTLPCQAPPAGATSAGAASAAPKGSA